MHVMCTTDIYVSVAGLLLQISPWQNIISSPLQKSMLDGEFERDVTYIPVLSFDQTRFCKLTLELWWSKKLLQQSSSLVGLIVLITML